MFVPSRAKAVMSASSIWARMPWVVEASTIRCRFASRATPRAEALVAPCDHWRPSSSDGSGTSRVRSRCTDQGGVLREALLGAVVDVHDAEALRSRRTHSKLSSSDHTK